MKKLFVFFCLVVLLCGATLTAAQNVDDLVGVGGTPVAQGEMREPTAPPAQRTDNETIKVEKTETVERGNVSAAASAKAEVVNHYHPTKIVNRYLPAPKPATTRPSGQGGAAMPQNLNINISLPPQVAGTAQGGTLPADPGFNGLGPVDAHTAFPGRMSYFKGENGSVWLRTEPAGGSWGDWLPWVTALAAIAAVLWALAQASSARDRAAQAEEEARRAQAARPQAQRRPPRPAQ